MGQSRRANGGTYDRQIDKAGARIDFARDSADVRNHIHGLSPFPGAWTMIGQSRVKVLKAEAVAGAGEAGTALDDRLTIACATGAIRFLEVQREGKGAMPAEALLRGLAVPPGTRLI